jgi:signal transduction histidine kinase
MLVFVKAATRCTSIALLCLSVICISKPLAAAGNPAGIKTVLVLFSIEGMAAPANQILFNSMRSVFSGYPPKSINLLSDSLALEFFTGETGQRRLANIIQTRYAGEAIDIIVPVGPPVIDFMLRNRQLMFPEVPVVFCAHAADELHQLERGRGVTGVAVTVDLAGTIDLMLQLHPGLRQIAVVAGTGLTDRFMVQLARHAFEGYADKLEWIDLTGLPMQEVLYQVAHLPPATAIFYLSFQQDGAGKAFVSAQAMQMVSVSANAPLYNVFDPDLGYESVGGRMTDFDAYGKKTAEIALRVLSGEEATAIEPVAIRNNPAMFDWRQLRRWGIDESALPPGSIVRFRQFSVWESYRWWIIGLFSFMGLQSLMIGRLVVNGVRRRRAEQAFGKAQEVAQIESFRFNIVKDRPDWTVGDNAACGLPADFKFTFEGFQQIVHPDDLEYVKRSWDAALKGAPYDIEFRIAVNETVRWLRSKVELEFDKRGNPLAATGAIQDISRRKRAEEEAALLRGDLTHMSRVSTIGEIGQNLAHEINQPLGAIMANAEAVLKMLEEDPLDLTEMRAALGDIVNDDLRARDVVQRIRGMVKKSPPAYTLVDLNRVAADTVKVIQADAAARNARIQMDLHDDLPAVRGDAVQLQQVALNLIVNALEALGPDESMPRLITVTSGRRPDGVCIWVSDTGTGIGKQKAERLFEHFFTTKTNGLGLGLSISRSIVEAHRGKMGVSANPGRGATFFFSLPAATAENTD